MHPIPNTSGWLRVTLLTLGGLSVAYCLTVLLTVATASDLGIRWMLIGPAGTAALEERTAPKGVMIQKADRLVTQGPTPEVGDLLIRIGARRIQSALDVSTALLELSGPKRSSSHITESEGRRWVDIEYLPKGQGQPVQTFAALQAVPLEEIGLTMVWFLLQLFIFAVGAVAVRRRPFDRPARLFFAMCIVAMCAFAGGFHWWWVAGSRWLGPPFLVGALLLPVVTLHFFLVYPRPKPPLLQAPLIAGLLLYVVPAASVIVFLIMQGALLYELGLPYSPQRGMQMLWWLSWLRVGIYAYLGLAGLYFAATLAAIVHSVAASRNPLERQQVVWILWAGLIATAFIGYSLGLAYWNRVAFALGGARVPMFLASLVFMLAYAVGIVRHKLMLAEEWVGRSVWYHAARWSAALTLTALTVAVAVLAGRRTAHLGGMQAAIVTVVLVVAMVSLLWGRDLWQRWVDRRWFREKYRLDKALQRINRAVGQFSDPQFLSERTLLSCRDGLQAEWAALYLRDPTTSLFRLTAIEGAATSLPWEWSAPAQWLANVGQETAGLRPTDAEESSPAAEADVWQQLGADLVQPVEIDGETAGLVAVGPKPAGSGYTAEDAAFLAALTQITGVALHCVRVHQDLTHLNEQLRLKVERIAHQKQQIVLLQAELAATKPPGTTVIEPVEGFRRDIIKGTSPALESVLDTARKVASSEATVLLRGESGTGKELLARTLHDNSPRRNGPLITVHCAALAPSLLESELFGHVRGAFTGATADKRGRFELANGGTLFLDEIGELSPDTQVKLLRALQEREIEPVGGSGPIRVDVRLIAATHRPLEQLIAAGKFREDLYYRLNVVSLVLPALRERKDDLHELAAYFLKRASSRQGKQIDDIDEPALDALLHYQWPGNIRELENVIERAVVLAERDVIRLEDLPVDIQQHRAGRTRPPRETNQVPAAGRKPLATLKPTASFRELESHEERRALLGALQQAGGNKARAAKLLGLPRSTFFSKLKKHALAD
jgi:transcriptional regulator with GAF, ATPase, and Fis domain